ncbi:regulated by circadian rhythms/ cholesterol metabolic process, partial [Cryphonectria parasitica EP155]
MVLEAVMIVVDNSEHSRNGDYAPTRFGAQRDAVNILFQSITTSNPESSVGLMSMGGNAPEVLSTLTTEQGRILEGLHRTQKKIGGEVNLATGIQVASLALKHRQNKTQRQRIVAFVCSPVQDTEKTLVSLAKKLKKVNTSVDFVLFGETEGSETYGKLTKFNEIVKSGEGSHLVAIPAGVGLLSDQLVSSPIMQGEGGAGVAGAGADTGNDFGEFGFDPNNDPELALALRMSMEEEQARRDKQAREEAEAAQKASLESVKEEDESSKPLLDQNGEPSGSGASKEDKKDGDKS